MTRSKEEIIKNVCYTELVYKRINKKLSTNLSQPQIQSFILEIFKNTNEKFFIKTGKNYYVLNTENNIRLTINSNTYRIITVDRLKNV
jgi:adenosine deaminase